MKMRLMLRHWCWVSRLWGWGMVLDSTGRVLGLVTLLWQVACKVILADHVCFKSLVWPCMMARHHWHHTHWHAPCSAVCLTVFPFWLQPRTLTIGFFRIESIRSDFMILECSFPLKKNVDEFGKKKAALASFFHFAPIPASTSTSSLWM